MSKLSIMSTKSELRKMAKMFEAFKEAEEVIATLADADGRRRGLENEIQDLTSKRDAMLVEVENAKADAVRVTAKANSEADDIRNAARAEMAKAKDFRAKVDEEKQAEAEALRNEIAEMKKEVSNIRRKRTEAQKQLDEIEAAKEAVRKLVG